VNKHAHPDKLGDEELLQRIREGCEECFAVLFERHFRHVFAVAYRILRDASEAEDIMQEVFLDIFLRREAYDASRGSPRSWMLQFAYFKSLVRRRYLRIRHFYADAETLEAQELHAKAPANLLGMNPMEWDLCVENGINLLDIRQRQAIELVHFHGYTLQEASGIMGSTLANTKNLYYRGMKALREYLLNAELAARNLKGAGPLTNAFMLQS
jgi:RNA polymerase sigma-70 factor (ECF subfamily)